MMLWSNKGITESPEQNCLLGWECEKKRYFYSNGCAGIEHGQPIQRAWVAEGKG